MHTLAQFSAPTIPGAPVIAVRDLGPVLVERWIRKYPLGNVAALHAWDRADRLLGKPRRSWVK